MEVFHIYDSMNDNCNNQMQKSLVPYELILFLFLLFSKTKIWKELFLEEHRKNYHVF